MKGISDKLKLNKDVILLYFVFLSYLKPYNVTLVPTLDKIFKLWKIVATIIILAKFVVDKKKIHRSSIFLMLFLVVWTVSLVLNRAPIGEFINNIMSIIGVRLLFECYYDNQKFKENIAKVLYDLSFWFIVLNLVTVVLGHPFFAGGMKLDDNANFLGGDNYGAFILITFCGFMFFHDMRIYKKIRPKTLICSFASIGSLMITFSFMGILAHMFLYLALLIQSRQMRRWIFRWQNAVVLSIVIVFSIAYLHVDQWLVHLLAGMGKSGFNGRNYIWPLAIQCIIKKPILGYGGVSEELAKTWILAGANHTHSIMLEYPFSVGVIGTCLFGIYFVTVLRKTKGMFADSAGRILLFTLTAYIVCGIMDFYIGLINLYLLLDMIDIFKHELILSTETRKSYNSVCYKE